MLLERLTIENYGVYEGKSEFDLSSTVEKPIVLIGGFNGAGKTTIFESLMIALYGKTYFGRRTTKKDYMEFVAGRLHRHGKMHTNSASVELSFRFYHRGRDDEYTVNRSWIRDGASVSESLLIRKNGEPMNDVDESQWQSFIESMIPIGIARLFFFDGEKIVRMAEWSNSDNDEIKSSLDMLLGAEIINRLHSDLDLYLVRRTGKISDDLSKQIQNDYDKLLHEKESLTESIKMMVVEVEKKNAEIDELTIQVSSKESKIAGIGGGYADIRERLLTEKATLEEKIRYQRKTISEELSEDAPLYLVSSIMDRIKRQIKEDMDSTRRKMSEVLLQDGITKLKKEMESEKFWPEGVNGAQISSKILDKLDSLIESKNHDVFFDVAPNDAAWIMDLVSGFENGRKLLCGKINEYSKTMTQFAKTESDLIKIPKDDEIGPRISEINSIHEEIGVLRSEVEHIQQEISSKSSYQRILQNKLKNLIESIHKNEKADTGIHLASKMKTVLDTYYSNLKERKMKELESNLLEATRTLLHKQYIHKIRIDRDTFEIMVYENGDDEEPGHLESMGEKQIIGTALLWAIAKTSGRSLPFVIDTPLSRLDGKHLSNLMDNFYPFASHQLVLLSTDREIGPKEYELLSKYTSRSYRITCDERKSVTAVSSGYFTERKKIAQT